mmetsp:Transcript_83098/g.220163  ORF Transcript_83098/g.220163 Transcript_83098/m.220163 type:complete len:280 (-) Transcript_83098:194-1033(-)
MPARLHACSAQATPKGSGPSPWPVHEEALSARTDVEASPSSADSRHVSAWRPPRLDETTPERAAPRDPPTSAQNRRVADCISVAAKLVPRRYIEPHSLVHLEAPKLRLLQRQRATSTGLHRMPGSAARRTILPGSAFAPFASPPLPDSAAAAAAFGRPLAPPRRSIRWTSSATRAEHAPKLQRVLRQDMPRLAAITAQYGAAIAPTLHAMDRSPQYFAHWSFGSLSNRTRARKGQPRACSAPCRPHMEAMLVIPLHRPMEATLMPHRRTPRAWNSAHGR